jgi:hypothetical protein
MGARNEGVRSLEIGEGAAEDQRPIAGAVCVLERRAKEGFRLATASSSAEENVLDMIGEEKRLLAHAGEEGLLSVPLC